VTIILVSFSSSNMTNQDSHVIFNPVLTFIASNSAAGTTANIKTVVLARFSGETILEAKNRLWDTPSISQILGTPNARVNSKIRSAEAADLGDIFDAFSKLEEADKLPRFAVFAEDLHLLPRIRSEDIDIVSIAERLADVENIL
jgi:hypothetical protein